jgi:2-methylcitrate dehydratase
MAPPMTKAEHLARWVCRRRFEDLSREAAHALTIRVLDSLGCAIAALDAPPIRSLRSWLDEVGGAPRATLVGGGQTSIDRAAFYNGALVRCLDFNDSYLAAGETCHPSDNLGAVLAAAEERDLSGRELLVALAVAYQVQARLSDLAPVRRRGFDHTVQGSYAAAAGVARALGLGEAETAHAIAISGTAGNALRVTRTGRLSQWKGLAAPHAAFVATHAALLARHGISGPLEVFEGAKGFEETLGGSFTIDWEAEDLERVRRTIIKKHNAEIHSQSALEAALELRASGRLVAAEIRRVEVDVFDVAYHIIGGGEEGDKHLVETREEADHSLPYMVAVALLDGSVGPEQYAPERIRRADVQELLRRVHVRANTDYSARFPESMPAKVRVHLGDERVLQAEREDYEGFVTHPMTWETAEAKFDRLTTGRAAPEARDALVSLVRQLEDRRVRDLTAVLARIRRSAAT